MDDKANYKSNFLGYYSTGEIDAIYKIYSNEYNLNTDSVIKCLKNNNFSVKKITKFDILSDQKINFGVRLKNIINIFWNKLTMFQKIFIPTITFLVIVAIFAIIYLSKPTTNINMLFSGDAPMRDEIVFNHIVARMKHEGVDDKIINNIKAIDKETSNKIDRTLNNVSKYWRIVDVNDDGIYNSIDAAVLFFMHYPDRNNVLIISNENPNTGFKHLFNAVQNNGIWRVIEPQAKILKSSSYLMNEIWGSKYDGSYNKVDNGYYSYYARQRFLLDFMNLFP